MPCIYGPVVKRLRHRSFTAITRVRLPAGSPLTFQKKYYNFFIKERKMKMFDDFTLRISCEEYYDEDMWELIYGAENGFDRVEKD